MSLIEHSPSIKLTGHFFDDFPALFRLKHDFRSATPFRDWWKLETKRQVAILSFGVLFYIVAILHISLLVSQQVLFSVRQPAIHTATTLGDVGLYTLVLTRDQRVSECVLAIRVVCSAS